VPFLQVRLVLASGVVALLRDGIPITLLCYGGWADGRAAIYSILLLSLRAVQLATARCQALHGRRKVPGSQARDRPGDDQLLDLGGPFEDRVVQALGVCSVRLVLRSAAEQASRDEAPSFLVLPNPTGSGAKTRDDVHFRPLRSGDIPSESQLGTDDLLTTTNAADDRDLSVIFDANIVGPWHLRSARRCAWWRRAVQRAATDGRHDHLNIVEQHRRRRRSLGRLLGGAGGLAATLTMLGPGGDAESAAHPNETSMPTTHTANAGRTTQRRSQRAPGSPDHERINVIPSQLVQELPGAFNVVYPIEHAGEVGV
jgi:hypothetical protein